MTIVLFQIFLQIEKRDWHLTRIFFSSSLDPQKMSLNIDMKRILLVKFSGVSPNLNIKHFFTELQRIETWENIPLEFHWLTVDSVQVSVFLR